MPWISSSSLHHCPLLLLLFLGKNYKLQDSQCVYKFKTQGLNKITSIACNISLFVSTFLARLMQKLSIWKQSRRGQSNSTLLCGKKWSDQIRFYQIKSDQIELNWIESYQQIGGCFLMLFQYKQQIDLYNKWILQFNNSKHGLNFCLEPTKRIRSIDLNWAYF